MKLLGLEVGSWAEILSSLFAGIAMLLIIWQVSYEKNINTKQHHLEMLLQNQNEIMRCNEEFYVLIASYTQLLINLKTQEKETSYEFNIIRTQMSGLVVSMSNMSNISLVLANKLKIKNIDDAKKFTGLLAEELKGGIEKDDISNLSNTLAANNFAVSNVCKKNIEIILNSY